MRTNKLVRPFLKWAGGKRQLIPELMKRTPKKIGAYYEPFLGAGALLLELQRKRAVVNDKNGELINCYTVVRDSVDELIEALSGHHNDEDYFYQVRDWDRQDWFSGLSPIQRAARIIFLNKTCYNGLFRVNAQGQFNVPFGRYRDPNIVDVAVLKGVSEYLRTNDIRFYCGDFATAVETAKAGDFVYCDPPYDPVSDTSSFTGYDVNGFDRGEQLRLKIVMDTLTRRNCKVLLSNAATPFILDLYKGYFVDRVEATRAINSVAVRRGKVMEVLISNYDTVKE